MSKGLEALKHLYTRAPATTNAICVMDYEIIQKELKALEIIKKKGIDLIELKNCKKAKTYNENTKRTYCEEYTDEEYDLLKEVLL